MGNDQGKFLDTTTPEGVRTMDENLQRKFSKGIQYNMKVIIRGDRNTGKTCLFKRMQGKPFTESYIPTGEIQVDHIQWTYPGTSDTVKVEIWDVVDQGRSSKKGKDIPLKLSNASDLQDHTLDANFLDVYKGAHGIIFIYDITKQWTWQYVEREIQNAPLHIPIVVVGNYRDMQEHRSVAMEDSEFYVTHLNRPESAAEIRYAESCLKNGFGLRYLHKFLSIPFLQLQQESLLHQLKNNREQIMFVSEGLDTNDEQEYDKFIAERNKPPLANKRQSSSETPPTDTHPQHTPVLPHNEPDKPVSPPPTQPVKQPAEGSLARRLSSKFTGFLSKSKTSEPPIPSPKSPGRPRQPVGEVDDFVPEGELDDRFFDGGGGGGDERRESESSSSDERVNTQVAMDEDLSSIDEEEVPVTVVKLIPKPSKMKPVKATLEEESDSDEDITRPSVTVDEDLSSEEETLVLHPVRMPVPKAIPPTQRPLKSARDIVITDSEEEEAGPVVMVDEDLPGPVPEPVRKPKSAGLMLAHHSTKPQSSPGGLLLDFNDTGTSSSATKEKKKSRRSSSDKHRKKKKSRVHSIEEEEEEEEDEKKSASSSAVQADPFDFTNSLDAWLASDDSPSLQPRSTHGLSKVIHQSMEEKDEQQHKKKKKKHRESNEGIKRKKSKPKRTEDGPTFDSLL